MVQANRWGGSNRKDKEGDATPASDTHPQSWRDRAQARARTHWWCTRTFHFVDDELAGVQHQLRDARAQCLHRQVDPARQDTLVKLHIPPQAQVRHADVVVVGKRTRVFRAQVTG